MTALPDADHRRYALLIFLWPTMLFWPSSIGKDCWMVFTLGIGALGAARVLMRRPGGYTLLVVGTLLGSLVRPHVALLELVAFGLAFLIGRQPDRRRRGHAELGRKGRGSRLCCSCSARVLVQRFGDTVVGIRRPHRRRLRAGDQREPDRSRRFGVLAHRSHESGRLRR